VKWNKAEDIHNRLIKLVKKLRLEYVDSQRLFCFRSFGSKSRARARIWSLPTVWQQALNEKPGYVIEVLSEKFDNLSYDEQTKILIHELLHIPKTFSGALRPHRGRYVKVNDRVVEKLFKEYIKNNV
jgi:predicted metallopeptidase